MVDSWGSRRNNLSDFVPEGQLSLGEAQRLARRVPEGRLHKWGDSSPRF